jgi:hypothetical protein
MWSCIRRSVRALIDGIGQQYAIRGANFGPAAAMARGRAAVWTGRIASLVVLFGAFGGIMKVIKESHVIGTGAEFGYPLGSVVMIGALRLAYTVIDVIPRSAPIGAILLTGYLGGAVASNVRVSRPAFESTFRPGVGGAASARSRLAQYNAFPDPPTICRSRPHAGVRSRE